MSHTPHELAEEFPEFVETMHNLKSSDAHFANLFEEYHRVNRTLHRMETNVEPVAEHTEKELRQKRSALKDEIYTLLKAA